MEQGLAVIPIFTGGMASGTGMAKEPLEPHFGLFQPISPECSRCPVDECKIELKVFIIVEFVYILKNKIILNYNKMYTK